MAQVPSENGTALKTRWERLHLLDKCGAKNPSHKVDVLRLLMLQTQWARAEELLDPHAASSLFMKYAERYSKIVDSPDPNEGVNNYAESALTLLDGKPNESKMWTSSLKDNIKSMKCVKDALELAKATSAMLYPEEKKDIPMQFTKPKPNPVVPKVQARVANVPDENVLPALQNQGLMTSNARPTTIPKTANNMGGNNGPFGITADSKQNQNPFANSRRNGSPNLNGQPSFSKKPGLLGDPRRDDQTRGAWNSNPGPSWVNGQSDQSAGQFRRNNFGGPQSNLNASTGSNNARGFNGNNTRPSHNTGNWGGPAGNSSNFNASTDSNSARGFHGNNTRPSHNSGNWGGNPGNNSDFSDRESGPSGPSNQRRGLFSGVRNNNSENFGRGPQDFNNGDNEEESAAPGCGFFKSARQQLAIENQKKFGRDKGGGSLTSYGNAKKSLGTRRGLNSKFVPPIINREDEDDGGTLVRKAGPGGKNAAPQNGKEEIVDERLKNIEPKMIELITNEIMDHGPPIHWDDIAGLEFAKNTIKEIVVWPMLRPDIFTGLRGPPKGLLLFGPPGTGKTLIGKCIASQSKSTFFSISASSLTSKWVGEGEKMVRALFAVARVHQPAVIFLDEIDSLLSQRSDGEHEASRRIKTEFLVQLDGATTSSDERILCVGATNRPQEIDEAARRRFVKRLYIPLPESSARRQIVVNLLQGQSHCLVEPDLDSICTNTDGYSGADMANLCREAALGPIRSINFCDIENITADQVGPITAADFQNAIKNVRPSVSSNDLLVYLDWNKQYGTWNI